MQLSNICVTIKLKSHKKNGLRLLEGRFHISKNFDSYFTASITALKASGLFIAKSANTLRFKPISLAANLPINCE
jgi:hypothetical protein